MFETGVDEMSWDDTVGCIFICFMSVSFGTYDRVCELGLEYGVWGMEFNSKLRVYKQEWHYQACLVFNPNPIVYY